MSEGQKTQAPNEDELSKIDAMIAQHSEVFEGAPHLRYSRAVKYGEDQQGRSAPSGSASVPQGNYRCHKCGETGHFIQDCPVGTEEGKMGKVRQARGIPKTFLETVTEAEAAKSGGAFVSAEGDLVVMKTASKEERLRLVGPSTDVELQRAFGKSWEEVKKAISCFLCSDVAKNPVSTPCCGEVFCRQCILSHLDRTIISLDGSMEVRECPNCDRKGIVSSELVPDQALASLIGGRSSINVPMGLSSSSMGDNAFDRKKKQKKVGQGNVEVELGDSIVPVSDLSNPASEETRARPVRHANTVLVPGGSKNPFFEKSPPLLSESEFRLWKSRFGRSLIDSGK